MKKREKKRFLNEIFFMRTKKGVIFKKKRKKEPLDNTPKKIFFIYK